MKKNHKSWRTIISIMLAGTMLLSLAACGGNEKETETPSESSEISSSPEEPKHVDETKQLVDLKELEEIVSKDVESTVSAMKSEYEKLIPDIDSYEKYTKNTDKVELFYKQAVEDTEKLCARMREYSISYAETVIASDQSTEDKYDALENLYDHIYEDAGTDIYDGIYDGVLDDIYNTVYDGILKDANDGPSYSEWLDVRSDEYSWWLDARSDVYDAWLDFRSDVYSFWLDVRSEILTDDIERAKEKIANFRENVEKMNTNTPSTDSQALGEENTGNRTESGFDSETSQTTAALTSGIRPEFKEAMESYEAFFDEYAAFMKEYSESDDPTGMLSDYTNYMSQYADTMSKMEAIGKDELSDEELKLYTETMNRITEKLLEIA